jgi:uncharacterized membrane protein
MEISDKVIQQLSERIEHLMRQQNVFRADVQRLQQDLDRLRILQSKNAPDPSFTKPVDPGPTIGEMPAHRQHAPAEVSPAPKKLRTPSEDFIGTNLLNKVGIAVLVLGIGFGAKYSIDHGLLNALTRMILGYLAGVTLIAIAFRLKESHTGFSAVLLSGGMAVLYFITFASYNYFGLIPQVPAFAMMVLFTVFTVIAAVRYNVEVIGIIGLVGAYAVPLLLSEGSGRVIILFSYISIINTGILVLAFQKFWKRLYYLAFILTWLTFGSWYFFSYEADQHTSVALIFSTLFFVTFYITFLAYKLIRKESLTRWDVTVMLLNSFIYFGYGYLTIESLENGEPYLGLFTVLNALMHFVAALVIFRRQDGMNDIFYFVAGMVLIFLTLAVPVQLEGNWVTLVWAGEAALLFWIGRSKGFATYEKLSIPLVVLAFLSLLHDWSNHYSSFYYYLYDRETSFTIFLNIPFLTSIMVGAAFVFIIRVSKRYVETTAFKTDSGMHRLIEFGLPLLTVFVFYSGFYKEIEAFWNFRYASSRILIQDDEGRDYGQYNEALINLKNIWLIIYSAIFSIVLCALYMKWKSRLSGIACLLINGLVLFLFMTAGLLDLGTLRSSYLNQDLASYYNRGYGQVLVRYVAIAAIVPLLWFNRKIAREQYFNDVTRKVENLAFHLVVLVLLSSELVHWLDLSGVENSFRLSMSILWGAYALFLIVFGLSRDMKHIRLGGMVLFGVTLLKLFAYDMADMSTILKTVVMIILGVLLLTASFIYNKYKRPTGNETL